MEKEYKIKGIDKIIGAISKEDLARYFETDQNANFEALITESLKTEIIETSMNVIKLAKKGINIPFYDIIEMKNILLKK